MRPCGHTNSSLEENNATCLFDSPFIHTALFFLSYCKNVRGFVWITFRTRRCCLCLVTMINDFTNLPQLYFILIREIFTNVRPFAAYIYMSGPSVSPKIQCGIRLHILNFASKLRNLNMLLYLAILREDDADRFCNGINP